VIEIALPYDPDQKDKIWRPRHYQADVWRYLENGGKRAMEVWHRRAGKDEVCLHWAAVAMTLRKGTYWHMLPEAAQARKAIWDAIDPHRGKKRIDIAFPQEIRKTTRNQDMYIETYFGSSWQVVGSDNYNSLVGSPPIGVVFSEWALADPLAWAYIKPILEENNGWALFITTSRGHNHAERMYNAAANDPEWHSSLLTPDKTGMFNEQQLDRIQKDYIVAHGEVLGTALFEQEYLCSFEAAILGAVYAREMRAARQENRITSVPYDPSLPVETWWDIGYRDPCAIWFIQRSREGTFRAIDYYENHLVGLDHYAKVLQNKGYVYSQHVVPHDAAKGEIGRGMSIVEQAAELGLQLTVKPKTTLEAGIQATRPLISMMFFDFEKCAHGLDALSNYAYEYDQKKNDLSAKPIHNWASHGADALRTGANVPPKRKRGRVESPRVAVI
jgi:hypothetical protein